MNYTVVCLYWTIRGWLKKNTYVICNFPLDSIVDGVIGLLINISNVVFLEKQTKLQNKLQNVLTKNVVYQILDC